MSYIFFHSNRINDIFIDSKQSFHAMRVINVDRLKGIVKIVRREKQ
jgi:hypothetical protein